MLLRQKKRKPAATLSPRELLRIQEKIERETGIRSLHDVRVSKDWYIYHGVWPAQASDETDRDVFVKVLLSNDPDKRALFERESWLYSHFRHDHLVRKEFSRSLHLGRGMAQVRMIVLEYVDGVDLAQLLEYFAMTGSKVDAEVALEIGIKILKALQEIHVFKARDGKSLNIVHADVSPHNVLLSRKGEVKLIDFGVARITGAPFDGVLSRAGKRGYMAPEQVYSDIFDHRADLYALGVVLAEMLLSRRLAMAEDLEHARTHELNRSYCERIENSEIDVALKQVLQKALEENPDNRYPLAIDFLLNLEDFVQSRKLSFRTHAIAGTVENVLKYSAMQETLQRTQSESHVKEDHSATKIIESANVVPRTPNKVVWKRRFTSSLPYFSGLCLTLIVFWLWKQSVPERMGPSATNLIQTSEVASVQSKIQLATRQQSPEKLPNIEDEQGVLPKIENGRIIIKSMGARIHLTDGKMDWKSDSELSLSPIEIDVVKNYTVTVTRARYRAKTIKFTLDRDHPEFLENPILEKAGVGTLFVGASPWAEVSIPGYANQKPIPFSLTLSEGEHKVTARYQDEFGKWQYLTQSVRINPNSRMKCLAYFEGNKIFECK